MHDKRNTDLKKKKKNTLKMQKAERSLCQDSQQLAAWACQLHMLVPK